MSESKGHWWCKHCGEVVDPHDVTYLEFHEKCGSELKWCSGTYAENKQDELQSLRTQLAAEKEKNAKLKTDLESEFNPDWDLVLASQESLREHMIELAEVTAERDRLKESLLFLDQQGYDHHTPHMICVLKPDWKEAMKSLQESAPDE